jgi:HPt (histidine-containing phosphotransfer) domain-containing protein
MDDILSKPCALEECANVLARWIGSPRRALEPRLALPDEPSAQGTTDHASANDVGWASIDGAAVTRLRSLRSGGQSDLYERLIELFESGSARALVELRNAIERGRFEEAAAVCHRFASSAANVGALGFASHVRELERLCKAADAGHSLGLFLRLRAVHPQLLDNLHGLRLKASA